jgi:hypothetical protein
MPKMQGLLVFPVTVLLVVLNACSAEDSGKSGNGMGGTQAGTGGVGGTRTGGSGTAGYTVPLAGGGASQAGSGGNDDVCADVHISFTQTPVNVILVVDRSETMILYSFGSYASRWDAVRAALLDEPAGLVSQYQNIVRFGFEGYTGFPDTSGQCPDIISVPYNLNNYGAIAPAFDDSRPPNILTTGQVAQTPTGESLGVIIDTLANQFSTNPDVTSDPFYLLIATDGMPDTCAVPNVDGSPDANQAVIDQVTRAFGLGINTYVLSVGSDTSDAHLQDVANAGAGTTNAPYWKAGDDQGLKDALSTIIGSALSCTVELTGEIIDENGACQKGRVTLNGNPISCDNTNGWRYVDKTHIELVGDACNQVRSSTTVVLEGSFPCDVVIG